MEVFINCKFVDERENKTKYYYCFVWIGRITIDKSTVHSIINELTIKHYYM